jgi:rod shape-determining protein MreB
VSYFPAGETARVKRGGALITGIKIGIDLGTTSVLIFVQGKGIVLREASVAALDAASGTIVALGNEVYHMVGRNPNSLRIVHPMKDGVISDFNVIHAMIAHYIKKICGHRLFKPTILICMPASVTGLERSSVLELAIAAGAARACLVDEPLAAALGAGLKIDAPGGRMIVDIGGGTTDAAIITMGSMAIAKSVRTAGNVLDAAIRRYLRRERNVLVGDLTSEEIKKQIGCATLRKAELGVEVRGQSYVTLLPEQIEVTSTEAFLAMRERLRDMTGLVHRMLEETPPEMAGDIHDNGIVLTGGGALLRDLDILLAHETGLKIRVADDPISCVANGLGILMGNEALRRGNAYFYHTDDDLGAYTHKHNI